MAAGDLSHDCGRQSGFWANPPRSRPVSRGTPHTPTPTSRFSCVKKSGVFCSLPTPTAPHAQATPTSARHCTEIPEEFRHLPNFRVGAIQSSRTLPHERNIPLGSRLLLREPLFPVFPAGTHQTEENVQDGRTDGRTDVWAMRGGGGNARKGTESQQSAEVAVSAEENTVDKQQTTTTGTDARRKSNFFSSCPPGMKLVPMKEDVK